MRRCGRRWTSPSAPARSRTGSTSRGGRRGSAPSGRTLSAPPNSSPTSSDGPRERSGLAFPVIVKPSREDGSAGITEDSIVEDEAGLQGRVAHVIGRDGQEAVAEEVGGGGEFNRAV